MRRRRPRASGVLFLLSLMLAAAATLALRGRQARLEADAVAGRPSAPVVVAAVPLARGAALAEGSLALREVPMRYVPPGALASVQEAAGRALASDVAAGEVITETRLAPPGGPVAALVPYGLRAVAVAAPVPRGALAPGDRVDVLATFLTARPHTEVVAEGAEVLGVMEGPGLEQAGPTVFLLVTPGTAERIAFARVHAELSLAVGPPAGGPGG